MTEHKKSRFTFNFRFGDDFLLYHSLFLNKLKVNKKVIEILDNIENEIPMDGLPLDLLIEGKFIIPKNFDEEIYIKKMNERREFKPHFRILYLNITTECNFDCKYCFEKEIKPSKITDMTPEIGKRAVKIFSQVKDKNSKSYKITFYGGEPLCNYETLKSVTKYAEKLKSVGQFNKKPLTISIVTNGSLITDEIGRFFKDNNIDVVISLDGNKDVNDKMRIYKNNEGTWEDVVRGIKILKEYGITPSISCTVGNHNLDILERLPSYFLDNFSSKNLAFNVMRNIPYNHPSKPPVERATQKIIDAFEGMKKRPTERNYEDRIMRKIRSFITEKPYFHDCSACGAELAISTTGDVSPCHVAVQNGDFIVGNIKDKNIIQKIEKSEIIKEWIYRSPINMEKCKDCIGMGICGGGCLYEAFQKKGDIWELDDDFCKHCKLLLNWMAEKAI